VHVCVWVSVGVGRLGETVLYGMSISEPHLYTFHAMRVLVLFASWLYTHTKAVLVCMSVGVDHLDPVLVLFVGDATHKAVNVMGYAVLIQMQ